jgi:hypothetical protein
MKAVSMSTFPGRGEQSLGLLYDDPAVQGTLKLFSDDLSPVDGALLEDPIVATSVSARATL